MTSASTATRETDRRHLVQLVAAAAGALAAALYVLIGLGILWVGEASAGGTPDLFAFGMLLGAVFAVTAVLLARFSSRVVWLAVAILQVVVIGGYVALSGVRIPGFELNGLLVKAAQAVVLVAVLWLFVTDRTAARPTADDRR